MVKGQILNFFKNSPFSISIKLFINQINRGSIVNPGNRGFI